MYIKTSVNYQSIIDEELVNMITNYYHFDLGEISPKAIIQGMLVELEHGFINSLTDVTHNNLVATYKLALAHLLIDPNYYDALEIMLDLLKTKGITYLKEWHQSCKQ